MSQTTLFCLHHIKRPTAFPPEHRLTHLLQAANLSPYISLSALILVGACTNEFDGILQRFSWLVYSIIAVILSRAGELTLVSGRQPL